MALVLILLMLPILPFETMDSFDVNSAPTSAPSLSYTEHANIFVDEFSDFSSEGFSGSGSEGSPFYIEGLNFTSSGTLIEIRDTDAYVEIRDCYFSETAPTSTAILLHNASYVTVKDCVFENISASADVEWYSNNFTFIDNDINGTSSSWINLWLSSDAIISRNTMDCPDFSFIKTLYCNNSYIGDNTLYNIYVEITQSNDSVISNNEITGGSIVVVSSSRVLIENNSLRDDTDSAFGIWDSSNCTLRGNDALNFHDEDGTYYVTGSLKIILENNTAVLDEYSTSSDYGFNIKDSTECHLENNSASSFLHFGFHIYNSSKTTAYNNSAFDNEIGGFYVKYSNELVMNNCSAWDNWDYGFGLYDSNYTEMHFCTSVDNVQEGFMLVGCYDGLVYYCQAILNGWQGFRIDSSNHTFMWDCQARNNSREGFYFSNSDYTEIWYSYADFNKYEQFQFDTSDYCVITNTSARDSPNAGFELYNSNFCLLNKSTSFFSNDAGFYLWNLHNTTLNYCDGGRNDDYGIQIHGSYGVVVNNSEFSDNGYYGVYVEDSDAVILENNQVRNSDWDDIRLDSSTRCILENNVLDLRGLYIVGDLLEHWIHTIPVNNLVDSRPIMYTLNVSSGNIDSSTYSQMILVNCSDFETFFGSVDNKTAGMVIAFSTNCTVIEVNTKDCGTGLLIINSVNCSVRHSDFSGTNQNNQMGIFSDHSPGMNITACYPQGMDYGILLEYSPDSLIQSNIVNYNTYRGIEIDDSPDSRISNNWFDFIDNFCIDVTSSDSTMIDNNTLDSYSSHSGIAVYSSDHCVVEDNNIVVQSQGIYLSSANGIRIENNTIIGNDYAGIIFTNTEDSEVYLNDIGSTGILFQTDQLTYWNHTFDTNDVGGLPLGYFESLDDAVLNAVDYGQLVLIDCDNVTVNGYSRDEISCPLYIVSSINVSASDYFITNTVKGIVILYSDNCSISNYTVEYTSSKGMYLYESNNVTITDAIVSHSDWDGIYLDHSEYCEIKDTETRDCSRYGIYLGYYSHNVSVSGHLSLGCGSGLYLYQSNDFTIDELVVYNCSTGLLVSYSDGGLVINSGFFNNTNGIYLWSNSDNNRFYLNELGGNTEHNARDDVAGNYWDDGSEFGNSWSDYESGDFYNVNGTGGGVDNYPNSLPGYSIPISSPENQTFFEGATGKSITWTSTAKYIQSWIVYVSTNGSGGPYTPLVSGRWTGGPVTISLDGLSPNIYDYAIVLNSYFGSFNYDIVGITVYEATPIIDPVDDIEYWEGSTTNSITWNVSNDQPKNYTIYLDGEIDASGPWDGSDIYYDIDGLSVAEHNVTLVVYSESGEFAYDTVFVTVLATSTPNIDSPVDVEFEEGTEGKNITWTVSDVYPDFFEIYINGVLNKTVSWDGSDIIFILDDFPVGTYNITLVLYSESGPSVSDSVEVVVTPLSTTTTTTTTTNTTTTGTTDPGSVDSTILILGVGGGVCVIGVILGILFLKKKK